MNEKRREIVIPQNDRFEQRLKQQQLESNDDSRWLAESETNLVLFFGGYCHNFALTFLYKLGKTVQSRRH